MLLASGILTQSSAYGADSAAAARGEPVEQACQKIYAKGWHATEGERRDEFPKLARPEKGEPFADPVYGTCVVRVTAHDREPPTGFARNDYSRRQAFNADNTKLFIIAYDGAWHLYDAASLRYLKPLRALSGDAEPQWHPTNPDLLYFVPRDGVGMKLYELNVRTDEVRIVGDFERRLKKQWPGAYTAWTRSEGSPSADLRYWAFQVDDADWNGLGMFTYDLTTDTILAIYDFKANGRSRPDHLSMSPSGNYVVVGWDEGPFVFTRDLKGERPLAKNGEHSDLARAADGDDVYVSVDYEKSGGPVYMVNLRTGERTDLFNSYQMHTATAMHFSGKAFGQPGWVLMSTYADYSRVPLPWSSAPQWLHRKVFAVQLKSNPKILNLAHDHAAYAKYWTEPQASVNRDFTRILFNSNWDTPSELDVDAYMIVLPRGAMALP